MLSYCSVSTDQSDITMNPDVISKCSTTGNSPSGLIDLSNLSPDCFHLGQNVFIAITLFNGRPRIHLRKYTAYGNTCYPSKVGVTMSLTQWTELVRTCGMISNHLSYGIFKNVELFSIENLRIIASNADHKVTFNKEITSKTGNTFKSNITISEAQWNDLVRIATDVANRGIDVWYRNISFETIFKSWFRSHEFPQNTTSSDCRELLRQELQRELQKHIAKRLNEISIEKGEDLLDIMYNEDALNSAILGLDLDEVVKDYGYKTIIPKKNDSNEKCVELLGCIDETFLKSVKLNVLLNNIRKELQESSGFQF